MQMFSGIIYMLPWTYGGLAVFNASRLSNMPCNICEVCLQSKSANNFISFRTTKEVERKNRTKAINNLLV